MIEAPRTFVTERLLLRIPTAADDETAYSFASDPQVTRYMDWRTHTSIRETIEHRRKVLQAWEAKTDFTWRIATRDSGQVIGAVGARAREARDGPGGHPALPHSSAESRVRETQG